MHPGSSPCLGHQARLCYKLVLEVQQEYGPGVGCWVFPVSVLTVNLKFTELGPKKTLQWGEISGLHGFKEQHVKGLLEQSAHCHDEPSITNDLGQAQLPSVPGGNEETVAENVVTTVLNMLLSSVLFSSCYPGPFFSTLLLFVRKCLVLNWFILLF